MTSFVSLIMLSYIQPLYPEQGDIVFEVDHEDVYKKEFQVTSQPLNPES